MRNSILFLLYTILLTVCMILAVILTFAAVVCELPVLIISALAAIAMAFALSQMYTR